jgi:hypothetical protein
MLSHPELRVLFCNLSSTVIDARAKSTVEKYAGGCKRFDKWTENIVKFLVFYFVQKYM